VQKQEIQQLATCKRTIKSAKWKGTLKAKQEVTIKMKEKKDGESSAKNPCALKW